MQIDSESGSGQETLQSFRWAILGLVFLGEVSQGLLWFSAFPLVLVVERDLHLVASQVALWANLRLMFVCLLAIPAGLLIDRQGAARMGRIGFTLFALGATARGFTNSYATLLIVTALYSIGSMMLSIALPKALATWFPPRGMGFASGMYLTGYGLGASLALSVVHPTFGDNWRLCLRVTGLLGIAAAIAWWIFSKEPPGQYSLNRLSTDKQKLVETFKKAFKSRVTWLLTCIFFLYAAGFTSWFTFGFPFLARFRNVSQNFAGVLLMLTMVGYMAATLTMPALSDWVGYRRPFMMFFSVLGAFLFLMLVYWKSPTIIGVSAFLIGMFFGTTNPLIFTIAAEAKELGPSLMGASVGIISSFSSIAGFLVPTLTGRFVGSMSTASERKFHVVLVLASLYVGGVLVCALLLRETGRKGVRIRD